MRVLVAMDSFKGSASSLEAGEAVKIGILKANPEAEVKVLEIADGGEGTLDALLHARDGKKIFKEVRGPLENVKAVYGIAGDSAIIEMASPSGITLCETLDPLKATSYGTGQLISDALSRGIQRFILTLGGSATTEGGIGMLKALGIRFLDHEGNELPDEFSTLSKIESIDTSNMVDGLSESEFLLASDVKNPLNGPQGAVAIFGPQKGVKPEQIEPMDQAMAHYAMKVVEKTGKDERLSAGAGAAGGMGFAALSFFNSKLQSGIDLILDFLNFNDELENTDVLVIGEGKFDQSSLYGKAVSGLARRAKEKNVLTIALAGSVEKDLSFESLGISSAFSIQNQPMPLNQAMNSEVTLSNMEEVSFQIFSLIQAVLDRR